MVQPGGYCFKAAADRYHPLPARFHHRHGSQLALTLLRASLSYLAQV
jgi:hypothetical protein